MGLDVYPGGPPQGWPQQRFCPEAAHRASLTDKEFWDHVFNRPDPAWDEHAFGPDIEEVEMLTRLATPCPECGQHGACAWDAEGRPMIHVTEGETDV